MIFFFIGTISIILFFIFCDLFNSFRYLFFYAAFFAVLYGVVHFFTENSVGAETLEHEDGVSLRQDSNTIGTKSLFIYYNSRSHMGGGLSGGK